MNDYSISETCRSMSFREILRWKYQTFEEERKKRQETERSEYSDLEKELQRKYDELFGDDEN